MAVETVVAGRERQVHRTRATVDIDAPAEAVHRALTGVAGWPVLYPWIAHTEVLAREGADDEVKFWAVRPDGSGLRVWTSKRTLDPVALRMEFEQRGSVGPIEQLGGTWDFVPRPDGGCRVESGHWFTTDADPDETARELDRHGALQMRTLKSQTESATSLTTDVIRAKSEVLVSGGSLAGLRARLLAALPAGDGDAWFGETSEGPTVQIAHGDHVLVQKLLSPPGPADLYRRRWRLGEEAGGVRVTADVLAVATHEHERVRRLAQAGVRDALAVAGVR
ncbi:SRPBCC family protein [Streptomyces sp. NBC_00005]|uniref:SRPBCC family protein n=1 Tax=Streptomyces sp. NBC_00005 TaxID=2903609 RepID=UPI0032472EB5